MARGLQVANLVRETLRSFRRHEVSFRAAALAYHTFLSLFPLLLFLIFLGSAFLASSAARDALDLYLSNLVATPGLVDEIRGIVDQTVAARGAIGTVGVLGLIWSASAVFSVIASTFEVIWESSRRPFWRQRVIGLLTVFLIAALFLLSLLIAALGTGVLAELRNLTLRGLSVGLNLLLTLAVLWMLYRILPNRPVNAWAALGGALLAGSLWEAAKWGFSWYLSSGFVRFGMVYGSLASIVILIVWLYVSAVILFLGAEFGATLQREFWPLDSVS